VTSQEFIAKLQAMFGDTAKFENVATAYEIKEANNAKSL
jgi:hypothetical protein